MNQPDILTRIQNYLEYQQEIFGTIGTHELGELPKNIPLTTVESSSIEERLAQIESLADLRDLCENSDVLRTDLPEAKLVFGVGNERASLMLIGEAPGETEDRLGEPFVGEAGQLLNKMLAAINVNRDAIYIANVGKRRPKNNRTPTNEECEAWWPFLEKQIQLVNPSLILCLGGVAAHTVLKNNASVGSLRGKFFMLDRTKTDVLVTYHPSALLRDASYKRPAWEDLQLLRKRYDELGLTP